MKKNLLIFVGLAIATASGAIVFQYRNALLPTNDVRSGDQNEESICARTSDEITKNLKELSLLKAEEVSEKSAVRQTSRETKKNGIISTIDINTRQLKEQKCKAYPYPISDNLYSRAAGLCNLEKNLALFHAEAVKSEYDSKHPGESARLAIPDIPECDQSGWQIDDPKSK